MKILLTVFLALLIYIPEPTVNKWHDFHLSRTRIEYAAEQQEWQISLHVFIDDLALALEQRGAPPLRLGTLRESAESDAYIEKYLRQCLQLDEADISLTWEWLGKEISEDLSTFYIYLIVPNAKPYLPLNLKNKLLLDLYDDQQNMVQFIGSNKETQQLLLHQGDWEAELNGSHK